MIYGNGNRTTTCNYCGDVDIMFSDEHLSKNGKYLPMEVDLAGEIVGVHDCPERADSYKPKEPKKTMCWHCGLEIVFSEELVSKSGRKIPIDPESGGKHQCAAWEEKRRQLPKKYVKCRRCKSDIYWDERFKTDQGKWIPVDRQTERKHECV